MDEAGLQNCGMWIAECGLKKKTPKSEIRNLKSEILGADAFCPEGPCLRAWHPPEGDLHKDDSLVQGDVVIRGRELRRGTRRHPITLDESVPITPEPGYGQAIFANSVVQK